MTKIDKCLEDETTKLITGTKWFKDLQRMSIKQQKEFEKKKKRDEKPISVEGFFKSMPKLNTKDYLIIDKDDLYIWMSTFADDIVNRCAQVATTKKVEYDYGGVSVGCKYYGTEIDRESILKVKDLIK